jgi:ABC-type antimicrobial peptide transport system permease subunit
MENLKMNGKYIFVMIILTCIISSCVSNKSIDQVYINDGEMILSVRKIEKSEVSFQLYREGASGATGGKSSGGCGCN